MTQSRPAPSRRDARAYQRIVVGRRQRALIRPRGLHYSEMRSDGVRSREKRH